MAASMGYADTGALLETRLRKHWDTWVAKSDLETLKGAGITHLRVPFGFWILGDVRPGEPYLSGGWPFLLRLLSWCREIGLEVRGDS